MTRQRLKLVPHLSLLLLAAVVVVQALGAVTWYKIQRLSPHEFRECAARRVPPRNQRI